MSMLLTNVIVSRLIHAEFHQPELTQIKRRCEISTWVDQGNANKDAYITLTSCSSVSTETEVTGGWCSVPK